LRLPQTNTPNTSPPNALAMFSKTRYPHYASLALASLYKHILLTQPSSSSNAGLARLSVHSMFPRREEMQDVIQRVEDYFCDEQVRAVGRVSVSEAMEVLRKWDGRGMIAPTITSASTPTTSPSPPVPAYGLDEDVLIVREGGEEVEEGERAERFVAAGKVVGIKNHHITLRVQPPAFFNGADGSGDAGGDGAGGGAVAGTAGFLERLRGRLFQDEGVEGVEAGVDGQGGERGTGFFVTMPLRDVRVRRVTEGEEVEDVRGDVLMPWWAEVGVEEGARQGAGYNAGADAYPGAGASAGEDKETVVNSEGHKNLQHTKERSRSGSDRKKRAKGFTYID
ncbi:hypothetical protein HK102_012090, partial [Quaeritorhiza haematococci]